MADKVFKPACYCRVSTVHQVDKESIPAQVHMLTNYCVGVLQVKKADIEFYIDAGYSGKNTKRPEYERMIADIKAGKRNMVLAFKLDRISRNLLDFARFLEELKAHNTDFISLSESFDTSSVMGQGMLKLVCLFGEMERGITRERVLAVSKDIISRGGHLGGPTPLGYNYDKATKKYTINPGEAERVKLIFKLCREGESTTGISNYLNENKILSKRGGLWTSTTVLHILHNPAFKGLYIWNRHTSGRAALKEKKEWLYQDGIYPVIISPNDWQAVQDILKNRSKGRNTKHARQEHLFSNLISCGECGRMLHYRKDRRRKDGYAPTIYTCVGHYLRFGCTNGANLSDMVIAPFVLQYVSNVNKLSTMIDSIQTSEQLEQVLLYRMPEGMHIANLSTLYGLYTRANVEPVPGNVVMIKAAALQAKMEKDKALGKYYKALDRLKDLYLYGDSDISKEEYTTERKKIENKIAALTTASTEIERQISPALDADRRKYKTVFRMVANQAHYKAIIEKCGLHLLAEFFHDCLEGITTNHRQIVRITFKNGVSHNFSYD